MISALFVRRRFSPLQCCHNAVIDHPRRLGPGLIKRSSLEGRFRSFRFIVTELTTPARLL